MNCRFMAIALSVCLCALSICSADDKGGPAAKKDVTKKEAGKKGATKQKDVAKGKAAKLDQAKKIFEKISSLEGEWIATSGEHKGKVAFTYQVVAGESAVVEREFPGMPHEMITIYHLDNDKVMLNHYCMLGNQPRMKARMGKNENTIEFQFAGITNLPDEKSPHMHNGKLTFTDKDNITSTWTMYVDGEASEDHAFELTRKK